MTSSNWARPRSRGRWAIPLMGFCLPSFVAALIVPMASAGWYYGSLALFLATGVGLVLVTQPRPDRQVPITAQLLPAARRRHEEQIARAALMRYGGSLGIVVAAVTVVLVRSRILF